MAKLLPGAINFSTCQRDATLVCWKRRSNLIRCSFHTAICSNFICFTKLSIKIPIYRICNWIHIHSLKTWLASNLLPVSREATIARTFISNMFLHCFFLDFVLTLLGCIKVSFPITNITGNCKFVCKTHSSFLIICKINCWLIAFWT